MNPKVWYRSATVYALALSIVSHATAWAGIHVDESLLQEFIQSVVPAVGMGLDIIGLAGRSRAQGPLKLTKPAGVASVLVATLVAMALATAAAPVRAQTVPAPTTFHWTLPEKAVDGSPLTGSLALTKVEIFVATSPIPDTPTGPATAELGATTTTTNQTIVATVGGKVYARLRACNVFGCGRLTDEVARDVTGPVPGVPTDFTFEIQISAAPPPQ